MKAAAIAALTIPVFCAAADYNADLQAATTQADTWCERISMVSEELKQLGVELPDPGTGSAVSDVEATEDTQVSSEAGMFFDAGQSHIVYLGNVKLRDQRLCIDAREQLHIFLPSLDVSGSKDKVDTPAAATQAAPKAATSRSANSTSAPEKAPYAGPSGKLSADHAIADTVSNAILVYSPSEGGEIHLEYGDNAVHITSAADGKAPRILADPQGNILLEGADIRVSLKGKEGESSELCTRNGHVYYHAANRTIYAPGSSQFTHPQGSLSCQEMLCIALQAESSPAPTEKKGFMSQFTGLRFNGIATATARGQVVATTKASGKTPAAAAYGDDMRYNGETGACSLTGSQCRLEYDNYRVNANEGIHLLPNGDIELRGSNINGTYTREGSTPGTRLSGSFKANAPVIFRAELGTISTSSGMNLADEEADFSCTGPINLVLTRKEGAKPTETRPGMPNLAIAQYGDIARARAEGNVSAHRYDPATRKCIGELQAQCVETNLSTSETLLTGAPGTPLVAHYNGNRLVATPASDSAATVELRANGDIQLNGAHISAEILNEGGMTTAECTGHVLLVRAENRLETGSATRLQTEKAILTTEGPLHAYLVAEEGDTAPAKGKFTGLRFNYTGIREARTGSGCTVRTEKGSMQCTGPVHLLMNMEQKGRDKMLGSLKQATASGNVAVAGKDNTGRLFRATGDFLEVDNTTGIKELRGSKVTLADANNTHIASGKGAAIRIDANNNASIKGEHHSTRATNIKQQINNPKANK